MSALLKGLAPPLSDKFREWLGRDPHPSANGMDILHIRSGSTPQFRFEWHPRKRRVYLVRVGQDPEIGEVVAFDIETHGDAINAVNIYLRGYNEGRLPGVKPHLVD